MYVVVSLAVSVIPYSAWEPGYSSVSWVERRDIVDLSQPLSTAYCIDWKDSNNNTGLVWQITTKVNMAIKPASLFDLKQKYVTGEGRASLFGISRLLYEA